MGYNINTNEEKVKKATMVGSKSSCVAWFKLAELVTRKEKEKALSLYRLLSHSFEDKAYALQLEGDILWSLEDEQALQKYEQAAYLYKKEQNIVSAIAVYEHLLILQPTNFNFLSTLIVLYVLLPWPEKFEERYCDLLQNFDKGLFSLEQVFTISRRVINFIIPDDQKLRESLKEEENLQKMGNPTEYLWVLDSLAVLLKRKNFSKIKEKIKEYCLELDLDFNA